MGKEGIKSLEGQHPMGRLGEADEIAEPVRGWLLKNPHLLPAAVTWPTVDILHNSHP